MYTRYINTKYVDYGRGICEIITRKREKLVIRYRVNYSSTAH